MLHSSTLGRCLTVQGRYAEAEPLLRESYERTAAHAPGSGFIPVMLERLIELYEGWGRPARAEAYRALLEERPKASGAGESG
jgi:hypothetical protein